MNYPELSNAAAAGSKDVQDAMKKKSQLVFLLFFKVHPQDLQASYCVEEQICILLLLVGTLVGTPTFRKNLPASTRPFCSTVRAMGEPIVIFR